MAYKKGSVAATRAVEFITTGNEVLLSNSPIILIGVQAEWGHTTSDFLI